MTDQPSSHRTGAMNPWDSQSARIYPETEPWHSLNANENGGQSRDAVLAFAQNQRDEVRSLGEAAGSLAAEPGMKQQTFIKTGGGNVHSVDFRNGTENAEINGTLQAKESGMSLNLNNVVRVSSGFDPNQGAKAGGGVGYEREIVPTLEAGKVKGVLISNE